MDNKDQIKDLFAEKLGQMEVPVRAELWSAVSSQIGTAGMSSAGTGMSLISKVIIGVSVVAASTVAGVYLVGSDAEKDIKLVEKNEETSRIEPEKETTVLNTTAPENKSNFVTSPNAQNGAVSTEEHFEVFPMIEPVADSIYVYQSTNGGGSVSEAITAVEEVSKTTPAANSGNETTLASNQSDPAINNQEIQNQTSQVQFKLPNAFTPNGDGANDEFFVEVSGLSDFNIVILDQRSKVVFQSTDQDFRWDGKTNVGDPVPTGSYIYYITAVDAEGKKVSKYSSLNISR